MRREFQRRRDLIVARLRELPGLRLVAPQGAFYVFPRVAAHYGRLLGGRTVRNSLDFAGAALEHSRVALVPGSAFGADEHVRLSYATSSDRINEGLNRLAALLAGDGKSRISVAPGEGAGRNGLRLRPSGGTPAGRPATVRSTFSRAGVGRALRAQTWPRPRLR
jgi:hypothetical protein